MVSEPSREQLLLASQIDGEAFMAFYECVAGRLLGFFMRRLFHLADMGLSGLRIAGSIASISAVSSNDVRALAENACCSGAGVSVTGPLLIHWDGRAWSRIPAALHEP